MQRRIGGWILAAAIFGTVPTVSHALQLSAAPSYKSGGVATIGEFLCSVQGSGSGTDQIEILFETHMPPTWFAQYCQQSTGICYFDNQVVTVSANQSEILRVDLGAFDNAPAMGWVRLEARRVADPTDRAVLHLTYYAGMSAPAAGLSLDCSDNTKYLASGFSTDFFSPIVNIGAAFDSAHVRMETVMPGSWFGQFCQDSNGICYFEEASLPLAPNVGDNLRVDFFMFEEQGAGQINLEVHSTANPSIFYRCYYRVFVGPTTDAPDAAATTVRGWASPNPFQAGTDLRFLLRQGATGAIEIFSADGRLMRRFGELELGTGITTVNWDGRDARGVPAPAGVYYYRLDSNAGPIGGTVIRTQ